MDLDKIGKFIAACRKEKGMTQAQLGEALGVTYKAVSKWETGRCLPDASLYKPLCEMLGISLTELFNGEAIPREEMQEKSEEVIFQLAESKKIDAALSVTSYIAVVAGVIVIFAPILLSLGKGAAIVVTAAGLGLFLFGMALRIERWGRSRSKKVENSGMGICGTLTVLFIALKLTGEISWPWIWVVSPLWIAVLAVAALLVIVLAAIKCKEIIRKKKEK